MQKRWLPARVKTARNEDGTYRFTMTTNSVDRTGDIVEPSGGDFAAFIRNPIVAYGHDAYGGRALPVGRVEGLGLGEKSVAADVRFASAFDEFSSKVEKFVEEGFLNAVSIGFRVLDSERNAHGGFTVKRWEMLELSIVMIPMNADAMIAGKSEGRRILGVDAMPAPEGDRTMVEQWIKTSATATGAVAVPAVTATVEHSNDPPAWSKALDAKLDRVLRALGEIEPDNGDDPASDDADLIDADEVDDDPALTAALAALDSARIGEKHEA